MDIKRLKMLERLARKYPKKQTNRWARYPQPKLTEEKIYNYDSMTVREASDLTGLPMMTLNRMCRKNILPYVEMPPPRTKNNSYKPDDGNGRKYIETWALLRLRDSNFCAGMPYKKARDIIDGKELYETI